MKHTQADARPRIEVFADANRAQYRFGATGRLHEAPDVGAAVQTAFDALERKDAVIIINARAQTASDSSHDQ